MMSGKTDAGLVDDFQYFALHYVVNDNEALSMHMKNMFAAMKESLKEEVGSVKKDFLE